jgi:Alw26I/Eco31I/Esp3I family type II restriction m6 adenine DNA methyltransferase
MLTIAIAKRHGDALLRRAAGRYYTPEIIGRPLAAALAACVVDTRPELRIVDPFGGDGRLLVWFLREAAARLAECDIIIELWDVDGEAVAIAVESLEAEVRRLGLKATIAGHCADSFERALTRKAEFDVVITNPPWERLKPDPRELKDLDEFARDAYVKALRALDAQLFEAWPTSQPTQKWGGWGTNLSRVGIEVAHWLCRDRGAVGLVVPSSFLADSTSTPLRRRLLSESAVHHIAFYPAEMRVWDGADIDCVTVVVSKNPTGAQSFILDRRDRGSEVTSRGQVSLSGRWLEEHDWVIPVTVPPQSLRIIQALGGLAQLGQSVVDGKQVRLGRELDETGHKGWTAQEGTIPFIKGRDLGLMHVGPPRLFLTDSTRASALHSTRYSRFVWRDVTRPSQARRLIPAVLPPGGVTGNSVGVGWVETESSCLWAYAIAGLMSSVILEAQARALLATNHMSKRVVSLLRLPNDWSRMAESIKDFAIDFGDEPRQTQVRLEVAIARMLGFDLNSWMALADAVPAATDEMRQKVASQW